MFKKINWLDDFGIFVMRAMLGTVFLFHGGQKLFWLFEGDGLPGFAHYLETINLPYPAYGAVLAGAAEFVGGLALITGFGMRTMALPMMFSMGVASWYVHSHAFSNQSGGMEYPLTLGVLLFGLACTGPGKFSLRRLWPERMAYRVGAGEAATRQTIRETATEYATAEVESSEDIRRRVLRRPTSEMPIGEEHPQPVTRTSPAVQRPAQTQRTPQRSTQRTPQRTPQRTSSAAAAAARAEGVNLSRAV